MIILMLNKVTFLAMFLLLVFPLSSCTDTEAQKLIESSMTMGNYLNEYYDKLAVFTIDTWEMEAFNSGLRGISFSKDDQAEYQKTVERLRERKELISSFIKTVSVLQGHINNKSTDEVQASVRELGGAINGLQPMKKSKVVIPAEILGTLSGDIVKLTQFVEIKKSARLLASVLGRIRLLFEKEKDIYHAIIDERNNKCLSIIGYMIDNELVLPWPLMASAPGGIQLEMAVEKKPAKDEKQKTALKKVAEVKFYRIKYLSIEAEHNLAALMAGLEKSYNDFADGKKGTFEAIVYLAGRVGVYLKEINVYVSEYGIGRALTPGRR